MIQVYNQERMLPLSMQKKVQKQLSLLKKLKTGKPANETDAIVVIGEIDEDAVDNIVLNGTEMEESLNQDSEQWNLNSHWVVNLDVNK